jgi:hypothetical protein
VRYQELTFETTQREERDWYVWYEVKVRVNGRRVGDEFESEDPVLRSTRHYLYTVSREWMSYADQRGWRR